MYEGKPSPGSKKAIDLGCTCPVEKNNDGRGCNWHSICGNMYWLEEACPVHDPNHVIGEYPRSGKQKVK